MDIRLDYDTGRNLSIDFLKQVREDLESEMRRIADDIDNKTAFPAQLEDYAYSTDMLKHVNYVLDYLGAD